MHPGAAARREWKNPTADCCHWLWGGRMLLQGSLCFGLFGYFIYMGVKADKAKNGFAGQFSSSDGGVRLKQLHRASEGGRVQ